MDINEFLDAFKGQVKAHPEISWRTNPNIRGKTSYGESYCPLTFLCNYLKGEFFAAHHFLEAAHSLGLLNGGVVAAAADGQICELRDKLKNIISEHKQWVLTNS